jgi:hypothetical protein
MTQSTRTIAQIEAAIAVLETMIRDCDDFIRELRDTPTSGDLMVIGYPQYGFYLNSIDTLSGIRGARLMDAFTAARVPTVRNGKGEVAIVVSYRHAVAQAIDQQMDHATSLNGMLIDLEEEYCEAHDAAMDLMAEEAAYYDRFDGSDDAYEQRRDERAERDADARQDR